MSHFYGVLSGQAGTATRRGSVKSGLTVTAASWQGAVRTVLYEEDGVDRALIVLDVWHSVGCSPPRILYDGPISGE